MIKLTEEQAEQICFDDCEDGFELVENLPWIDNLKSQIGGSIFTKDGKTYLLRTWRSGSYYTDYHYQYDLDCKEAKKITKTIEEWVTVE